MSSSRRRKSGESVEARYEVACGAKDTDDERYDQAGGDRNLGVEPEAEDQQRDRQRRAADTY